MIRYKADYYQFKFVFTNRPEVFKKAIVYATSACILALGFKIALDGYCASEDLVCHGSNSDLPPLLKVTSNSAVYTGFTFVVGFLLVFRTSQAYGRYVEGATMLHMMRGEWFDACSTLIAFTRKSNDQKRAEELRQVIVRLFSLLHCFALQEISECKDEEFTLIDIMGLDDESLDFIQYCQVNRLPKIDVVFQWLQCLVTNHTSSDLMPVPPPIMTRVLQELSQGMVHFNNALKITDTPFPFPYAQMITVLLLVHWILTPFVVVMFTFHWFWCIIFAFIPVFCFWCINFIAAEIENPFGDDVNDLPIVELQGIMNKLLLLLLDPRSARVPKLKDGAETNLSRLQLKRKKSFNQAMSMAKGIKSNMSGVSSLDLSPEGRAQKRTELEELEVEVMGDPPVRRPSKDSVPEGSTVSSRSATPAPVPAPAEESPTVDVKENEEGKRRNSEVLKDLHPDLMHTATATYSLLLRLESLQQRQLEELTVLSTSGKDGVADRGKEYPDIMGKVIPEQQSRFECVSCADPAANDQPTSQATSQGRT